MRRRVFGRVSLVGLLLPLAFTANASAQSAMVATPATASPGQSITVTSTGGDFSSAAGVNPVAIRLSTRNGTVLSNPDVNGAGNITATFPVPASLTPGTYLILGTQTYTNGRTKSFTPDRVRLRVVAARRGSSSAGGLVAPIGGLIVLAGGCALVARRRRTLNHSQLGSR